MKHQLDKTDDDNIKKLTETEDIYRWGGEKSLVHHMKLQTFCCSVRTYDKHILLDDINRNTTMLCWSWRYQIEEFGIYIVMSVLIDVYLHVFVFVCVYVYMYVYLY